MNHFEGSSKTIRVHKPLVAQDVQLPGLPKSHGRCPCCFRLALIWIVLISIIIATESVAELEPLAQPAEDTRLGNPPPYIETVDQVYLMRFVRRILIHRVRDKSPYDISYIPPALMNLKCRAAVTLRKKGLLQATFDSEPLPVVDACRQAAESALAMVEKKRAVTVEDMKDMSIEIELIGPRERVGTGANKTDQMIQRFEPAVHGIAFRVDDKEILVKPSQLISIESVCRRDWQLDHECNRYFMAIENFRKKIGLYKDPPERKPASVMICRFRTLHLYEPKPDADPVHLIAGLEFVRPERLTREFLLDQVHGLARFIGYRQNKDGFFSYEFLPGRDIYWPKEQNWVRQAATAWALAVYARKFEDPKANKVLNRVIEAFSKKVRPMQGREDDAAYVHTPDGRHALGTSALLCLALIDAPERDRYIELREKLLNGMATMQMPDGSFRTNYLPSLMTSTQHYYPGEAILAMAKHYSLVRDSQWRAICDKALPFYVDYFRKVHPPMFVPWQVQAWGTLARSTMLRKYADFVYEMSDYLAPMQIDSSHSDLPIYEGGIDVYGSGRTGVSTGVYAEGFADAARTAEAFGDHQRAQRYRDIVRKAARFVVQLRFRESEAYYVQSPRDVIGAIRNTPINPTLRIDHIQHALAALMGAVEFMPQETKPLEENK